MTSPGARDPERVEGWAHDDQCEAEFIPPHGYTPCDCERRNEVARWRGRYNSLLADYDLLRSRLAQAEIEVEARAPRERDDETLEGFPCRAGFAGMGVKSRERALEEAIAKYEQDDVRYLAAQAHAQARIGALEKALRGMLEWFGGCDCSLDEVDLARKHAVMNAGRAALAPPAPPGGPGRESK